LCSAQTEDYAAKKRRLGHTLGHHGPRLPYYWQQLTLHNKAAVLGYK
jgi:hypothetical protein